MKEKSVLLKSLYDITKQKELSIISMQYVNAAKLRDTQKQIITQIEITDSDKIIFNLAAGENPLLFPTTDKILEMYNYYTKIENRIANLDNLLDGSL
jgi:hypothetical protein